MKKITKGIIIVLVFLVMAALSTGSYLTNQMEWKGIRQTGNRSDEGAVILVETNITNSEITLVTNTTIQNVPLPINISNYGAKTYTANIIGNGTNQTSVTFNNLLNHLVISPNSSSVTWRFKLTELNYDIILYDGTDIDQTGRMGLTGVEIALIGQINITIQNASSADNFSIYMTYI